MNIKKNTTPVQADVHLDGLIENVLSAFLDKLGKALFKDFRAVFPDYQDDYDEKEVKFKSGQTPFKKEKVDGKDPILYPDYKKQEEDNGTWGEEENPDKDGNVDSDKTKQVVVNDEGVQITPNKKDVPNLVVSWAPIMSKGYEGTVLAVATYSDNEGNSYEKQGVFKEKDIKQWLSDVRKEWNIPSNVKTEESRMDNAESSTKMTVTLQKVTAASSYDITLTKINANYDLSQVANDLDAILSDDGFVGEIPEEETTYLVVSDEDGALDIEQIEDNSAVSDIYQQLINETCDIVEYLRVVKWGAKGAIRNDFMSTVESMRWSFEGILDKLGEWIITETSKVPQIVHSNEVIDIDDLSAIELVNQVKDKVNQYLDNLDMMYVDFSSEQQSYIDTFKESIKSLCDYSLARLTLQ